MPNIALVIPPGTESPVPPPLETAQVASVLERDGHRIAFIDTRVTGVSPEDVPGILNVPDAVVFYTCTGNITSAFACSKAVRERLPAVPLVFFGEHVTIRPDEVFAASQDVDIIVRGEPEETLGELGRMLTSNSFIEDIRGISWRDGGKVAHNPGRDVYVNLNSLPFPAWHLLELKKYSCDAPRGKSSPVARVAASRGSLFPAPFHSEALYGKEFREKSEDRIIDELVYLKDRFDVREVDFVDDCFTRDSERLRRISERMIKIGLKLSWSCTTRPDMLDRLNCLNMKRAGCFAVEFMLVSASKQVLEELGMDVPVEQAENAVKLCHDNGLQVSGQFLLGAPGETPQTIHQTAEFARFLKLDYAKFSVLHPTPGTALYDRYIAAGGSPVDWERLENIGIENPAAPVFESDMLDRATLGEYYRKTVKFVNASGRRQEAFEDTEAAAGRSILGRFKKQ